MSRHMHTIPFSNTSPSSCLAQTNQCMHYSCRVCAQGIDRTMSTVVTWTITLSTPKAQCSGHNVIWSFGRESRWSSVIGHWSLVIGHQSSVIGRGRSEGIRQLIASLVIVNLWPKTWRRLQSEASLELHPLDALNLCLATCHLPRIFTRRAPRCILHSSALCSHVRDGTKSWQRESIYCSCAHRNIVNPCTSCHVLLMLTQPSLIKA